MIRLTTILLALSLFVAVPCTDAAADELTDVLRQGLQLQKDGHKRAALKAFRRAVALAPSDTEIRYNYGVVALQANERVEAMTAFQRVVTAKPDHGLAQFNLGKLLNDQRHSEDALPHLADAVRLLPDDAAARVELAWAQTATGQTKSAVKTVSDFKNPNGAMHSLRAFLALREGRWDTAVQSATGAVRAETERLEHRILLAMSMLYTPNRGAAMRALTKLYETEAGRRVSNITYALGLGAFLDGDVKMAKHRWSGLQGRNAAIYDPQSKRFDPMAFPTESDRAYLNWAKRWHGPSAAATARIETLVVNGTCQPGPIMVALLNSGIGLQRCLGTLDKPVAITATTLDGQLQQATATARKRTADCLVDVLNATKADAVTGVCAVQATIRSPR